MLDECKRNKNYEVTKVQTALRGFSGNHGKNHALAVKGACFNPNGSH